MHKLQRVINGTGVIIHTNLGRSPLGDKIFNNLKKSLSGYCNLEIDLTTGKRGKRGGFAEELICSITSAEDALIVNNNASSVFLILNEFAKGKEVIVSRGELIQIGGGFRIPDIMKQSGAVLVETGTTNITEMKDFEDAITKNTSMILSAHQSNYKIEGFTHIPSINELSSLKNENLLLVRDLGSGNLIPNGTSANVTEPTVSQEIAQGADIVCFSGDKLLGGCQAGIILGKKELISKLRKNPLMRMLRVDKVTYYILQEILINHTNGSLNEISLWEIILQNKKEISNKINRLMRLIKSENKKEFIKKVPIDSTFGGGSQPTEEFESYGIQIEIPDMSPDKLSSIFVTSEVPIIGIINEDKYLIDFIAVGNDDIPVIASVINEILKN